ncbi:MAG TPA: VTT domain-containing protein [Solirubrobacterales bacterium]|nr:VTT domain-containing protein [Solirubrobacterales bacterium]
MHRGPPGGGTWTGVAVTVAGILIGVGVAFAIPSLRAAMSDAFHGDTAALRDDLNGNAAGAFLVLWLALVHVIVWYPAEILDAAAGYVFGFGVGFPLVLACWVISGLASYAVGRHFARPLLYRIAGEERFLRIERVIHRGGALALIAVRLIPIMPFSLMGYVSGAARIPLWRFTWTTAVGYAPITAYFTYVGSKLEGFSAEDPVLWIGGGALLLAIAGARFLLPHLGAD